MLPVYNSIIYVTYILMRVNKIYLLIFAYPVTVSVSSWNYNICLGRIYALGRTLLLVPVSILGDELGRKRTYMQLNFLP